MASPLVTSRTGTPQPGATASADYSLDAIMTATGETAYYWDLASDRIVWARNAPTILRVSDIARLRTGTDYESLITEGLVGKRREAIVGLLDDANEFGMPYCLTYRLNSDDNPQPHWLEDFGRLQLGSNGEPRTARGVVRVITDRHLQDERLDMLFSHDGLTGQFNRAELCEAISDMLLQTRDERVQNAFLLIGIANLEEVNEAFGFDMGDEVIAAVAKRLRASLRETDIIGRFSSNKFGLLISEMDEQSMAATAERLLRCIRDEVIETTLGPVAVTVAVGGVLIPSHADTVDTAIAHAQEALTRAKSMAHDIFVAFRPDEAKKEARRRNREIADDLLTTLREQRLLLALQPIVRADTLEPVIHECLLRIRTPAGNIISAGNYVPVAERLGIIRFLDYRVLEMAIEVAHDLPDLNLTVNVSSLTTSDRAWLELLTSLVNGDRALARRLIVEITETAAIGDINESSRFVSVIKDLGCRVAMDDFGSGYSSFRNLRQLGLDMVKIDGSFVENMRTSYDDRLFVTALAELAERFGLEVVAENVADDETIGLLRKAGVTYLQGYHLGQPVLASELRARQVPAEAAKAKPEPDLAAE
jgi:diguanylate cyclase (GGDEF)-like protein